MKRLLAILGIGMPLVWLTIGAGQNAPPAADSIAQPDNYVIPWQSINAGGAPATSTNYQLNGSAGQSVIGYATSTAYRHGIGYWYGIGTACDCNAWCDLNGDLLLNPIDVVRIVNFVYKMQDTRYLIPGCPFSPAGDGKNYNGDWNCDGFVNPVDVVRYVNYVYKNQTQFPPCDPCACTLYPPVAPGDCPPWP